MGLLVELVSLIHRLLMLDFAEHEAEINKDNCGNQVHKLIASYPRTL